MSAPAPAPAGKPAAPAAPGQFARARWVEQRINELPKICLTLWNLLLDRNLPERFQEDVFATLDYVLMGGDMIPAEDEHLRGLDELNFCLHCVTQLFARLPPGLFDVHEQILLREGLQIREHIRNAPQMLGSFFSAVRPLYPLKVEKRAQLVKNAVKRQELLKILIGFVSGFRPPAWSAERLANVQAFLVSFQAPAAK